MCFNYKVSLFTFLLGTISSIILIKYGNPIYDSENIVFGIFLIFISLIQFMDFLFWIDLNNEFGINQFTTYIGPLLNAGQPFILYIIKILFFNSKIMKFTFINLFIGIINLLYFIYLIKNYIYFISTEKMITTSVNNHIKWKWLKYYNPYYYLLLLTINTFYLTNFNYSLILFLLISLFLYLSIKYFSYNIGEIWCFFGSFIPMLMIVFSYCLY